jgi:uncharacterized protein involved in exopolysaccharide biosynthesis
MNEAIHNPRVTWSLPATDYVIAVLGKYWRFVASCTLLVVLAVVIALLILPTYYEVSASLLFKLGREVKPPATLANAGVVTGRRPEDITSEIEIMKSPALVEKLVAHFGEDFFLAELPPQTLFQRIKAVGRAVIRTAKMWIEEGLIFAGLSRRLTPTQKIVIALQSGLAIEPIPKTDVINVRLRTSDPEATIPIINKLIDLYLEQHIAAYRTPKAKEFFEEQMSTLRQGLATAEQKRAALKESLAAWEVAEQRRQLLSQQRQLSETQSTTMANVARLQAEISSLTKRLDPVPREMQLANVTQRNPHWDSLKTRLLEIQANREQLRTKYTDDSRILSDLTRQIAELQRTLEKEAPTVTQSVTSGPNTLFQDVQKELIQKWAMLEGLQAQTAEQDRQVATLVANLRKLDEADVEIQRLNREIALLETNYTLYAKSLEDARISEAMDLAEISNISIIAPASSNFVAVSPRKKLLFIGALLLGFGGSITVIFILESLQPTVHARDDAEKIL